MIELRWLHDPFKTPDEISPNAVLVQDPKERGVFIPLILQYRESIPVSSADFGYNYISTWKDVPYEKS